VLTKELGMTLRKAAEILDVSFQRCTTSRAERAPPGSYRRHDEAEDGRIGTIPLGTTPFPEHPPLRLPDVLCVRRRAC